MLPFLLLVDYRGSRCSKSGLDSESKMVKGKPVVHDESDIRVTDKFDEERHQHDQQVKSSPQGAVSKVYSRGTPFTDGPTAFIPGERSGQGSRLDMIMQQLSGPLQTMKKTLQGAS